MSKLFKWYIALKDNVTGATAVEYGLIVALIAVVIIVAVVALGTNLTAVFQYIADKLGAVPMP